MRHSECNEGSPRCHRQDSGEFHSRGPLPARAKTGPGPNKTAGLRDLSRRNKGTFLASVGRNMESVWAGKNQILSVVVPVFKEEGNVPEFLRVITPILQATG